MHTVNNATAQRAAPEPNMNASKSTSHFLQLTAGAVLRLRHAAGTRISVWSGCAWITQDGDTRDIVLPPGRNFLLDRHGLAVVQMLQAGEIRVDVAKSPPLGYAAPIKALMAVCRDAIRTRTMAVIVD
jgi:hypothetical protein